MDTISLYKHRIDTLMDLIYGSGQANHAAIIEQLNYLLFLRALSIKDDEAELLGITDESEKIFTGDLAKYRWQNLLALNAEDLFKTLEQAFEVLQKKSNNATVKLLFRNAHVKIYDRPTLRRVVHEIEEFAKDLDKVAHDGDKDVFGDMYEYLLSKLSSAGTNGQFRTPRHIIDFMVRVVDPKKNETILDPACGTAGFLVAAYRYIAGEYTSEKMKQAGSPRAMDMLSSDEKKFLFNHMFNGFDSDEDMIKFGMMNLHLHGLTKSRLIRQNSLTDTTGMKDKFDVILANPPFSGKIDEESVSEDIRMGTKATELLFLRFMMDHLSLKGKFAVVVPEGVVASGSRSHGRIREMLLENGLWCMVSLPGGVFNPYSGVKTNILFLDKEVAKKMKGVLFVKINNDGFDLGAQRRPTESNDLPFALEKIVSLKDDGQIPSGSIFHFVPTPQLLEKSDQPMTFDRLNTTDHVTHTDWPTVELSEVATYVRGVTFGKSEQIDAENSSTIRIVTTKAAQEDGIVSQDLYFIPAKKIKNPEQLLIDGDILISVANSLHLLGRVTYVNDLSKPTSFGAFMGLLRADKSKVHPRFLHYVLRSAQAKKYFIAHAKTTTNISNINSTDLMRFRFSLPPLDFQEKIVAELDGYQKIVDGAKKMVENWRPLFEIEPTWEKVKLGDLAEYFIGLTYSPKDVSDKGIVVLRSSNVQDGKLDFSDIVRVAKNVKEKLLVRDGDILMCSRNGSKRLVGKIAVVENLPEKMTFGTFMMIIRSEHYQFLSYFFVSDTFRDQIKAGGSETSSINQITKSMLDKIVVPLPPVEVRKKIVERIEGERSYVEAAAKLIPIFEQKIKDRIDKLWD